MTDPLREFVAEHRQIYDLHYEPDTRRHVLCLLDELEALMEGATVSRVEWPYKAATWYRFPDKTTWEPKP